MKFSEKKLWNKITYRDLKICIRPYQMNPLCVSEKKIFFYIDQ